MRSNLRVTRFTAWLLLAPFVFSGCGSYTSKEASKRFRDRAGKITVTVYPVRVVRGQSAESDSELARTVAAFLAREDMADAVLATTPVEIPVKWHHNQALMAKESALAFSAQARDARPQTEYALMGEILCNGNETHVFGVHYYLAERNGPLADGGLTNSHWDEFKDVKPTDRHGGCEVLMRMLRSGWKRE